MSVVTRQPNQLKPDFAARAGHLALREGGVVDVSIRRLLRRFINRVEAIVLSKSATSVLAFAILAAGCASVAQRDPALDNARLALDAG